MTTSCSLLLLQLSRSNPSLVKALSIKTLTIKTLTIALKNHGFNSPEPKNLHLQESGSPRDTTGLLPTKDAKNVPVLLWFHGGGLLQGKRNRVTPYMLNAVGKYNIALVSADYRLAPQVGVAYIFEDVKDCVAFIRNKLPGLAGEGVVDVSRFAVSDSSAGGYLAFLAGLYTEPKRKPHPFGGAPPDVHALEPFIDPNGEVLANNEADSKRNGMYMYMLQEAKLASLLRFKAGDDTWSVAKKIYERSLPPAYLVHGDADTGMGVDQADEVVDVMVGCGSHVVYERLHGINHLFDEQDSVTLEKMYRFMMKHL